MNNNTTNQEQVSNQQTNVANNPYINNQTPLQNQGINNNPYINQGNVSNTNNSDFFNGDFVKGALIGAGIAFLLTNKTTQNAIFKGFTKANDLVQAGIEEIKERIEDAKAQNEVKDF